MSAVRKLAPAEALPVPMVSTGLFIVLTDTDATAHLIEETAAAAYWDGFGVVERCSSERHRDTNYLYLVRQTFGSDATAALPAPSGEALWWYVEHYEGRLQDRVRGLAACLISGKLPGGDDGGRTVDRPVPPPAPVSPVGALFAQAGAA